LFRSNLIQPGNTIAEETRNDLLNSYAGDASTRIEDANRQKDAGPLQALEDIVPSNIFAAASDNGNMLQVIFFAIFFGLGLILIPEAAAKPVKDFFDGFNGVVLEVLESNWLG